MKHIDSKTIGQMPIGIYSSAKTTKRLNKATIYDWLTITQPLALSAVEAVREGKYEKSNLMCATLSCVCDVNKRSLGTIESKNNIVVIDIDGKDNILDVDTIYNKVFGLPFVYSVSLSASGKGVYAIVPIGSDNIGGCVEAIADRLKEIGIVADRCCKDVTRLRFVGSNGKIKEGNIEVWDKTSNVVEPKKVSRPKKKTSSNNGDWNLHYESYEHVYLF